jgi:uncharacterized membrane protein
MSEQRQGSLPECITEHIELIIGSEQEADRRAHLNLQINLLTERETTKIIGMLLEIGKRFDIQHKVFDEESRQLSRLLAIETLIEALHSKFTGR